MDISYNPSKDDWEHLPMSKEAKEAMASFFMAVLESDNPNDIEEAKKKFKAIRRLDMKRWLSSQKGDKSGRY